MPWSKQSARLFLQSSELGILTPSPAGEWPPDPPFGTGGAHTLSGEGVGGPNSDEGTETETVILCVYIYVLCDL